MKKTVTLGRVTRRELLVASAATGAAMLLPRTAQAAALSYSCPWKTAFSLAPPSKTATLGYLTDFAGLGQTTLAKDMTLYVPWNAATPPAYTPMAPSRPPANSSVYAANVVGVIERLSWSGAVTDPITIGAYISQENAMSLRVLQQATLMTTRISSLGFWLTRWDAPTAAWYEALYPSSPVRFAGVLSPTTLSVDLNGAAVVDGVQTVVYHALFSFTPVTGQSTALRVATSPTAFSMMPFGVAPIPVATATAVTPIAPRVTAPKL